MGSELLKGESLSSKLLFDVYAPSPSVYSDNSAERGDSREFEAGSQQVKSDEGIS